MGFHTSLSEPGEISSKARDGSALPPYLETCIRNYQRLASFERSLAGSLIRDFISVWFDTKKTIDREHAIRVSLLSQPTEQQVVDQGNLFTLAVNNMYPEVNLKFDEKAYQQTGANTVTYWGYVNLAMDQLIKFPQSGSSPVEISVGVNPKFSFRNRMK